MILVNLTNAFLSEVLIYYLLDLILPSLQPPFPKMCHISNQYALRPYKAGHSVTTVCLKRKHLQQRATHDSDVEHVSFGLSMFIVKVKALLASGLNSNQCWCLVKDHHPNLTQMALLIKRSTTYGQIIKSIVVDKHHHIVAPVNWHHTLHK